MNYLESVKKLTFKYFQLTFITKIELFHMGAESCSASQMEQSACTFMPSFLDNQCYRCVRRNAANA